MVVRGPENARQPDNLEGGCMVVRGPRSGPTPPPPTLEQFPPPYNLHFQTRKIQAPQAPKMEREAPQAQKIEKGAAGPLEFGK